MERIRLDRPGDEGADLPKACTVEDFEALLPMNLASDPTLPRFTPRR